MPWRPAGAGVATLGTPFGIGVLVPMLGEVVALIEVAVILTVIFTAMFGSPALSDRAFRLLRWAGNRPEPPGPAPGRSRSSKLRNRQGYADVIGQAISTCTRPAASVAVPRPTSQAGQATTSPAWVRRVRADRGPVSRADPRNYSLPSSPGRRWLRPQPAHQHRGASGRGWETSAGNRPGSPGMARMLIAPGTNIGRVIQRVITRSTALL